MQLSRNIVSITLATGIGIFTGIKIFDPAFRELQVEKLEKKKIKQGEEGLGVRFVSEEREQQVERRRRRLRESRGG